jgi:crotonobetaine/carnitine-CoA ligase
MFGLGFGDTPLDAKYNVKTLGWWGMTETVSHPIIGNPVLPDRPMSMGRPAPEYEIVVVRDDGVTPVEFGESGQLKVRGVRGVSMFHSYLNQPDVTADSFDSDSWFITGDVVIGHEDGYLSFSHRSKDMIKVDGENVACSEVERVIIDSGLVNEAAVVGRPDPIRGEVAAAFVILREAGDDPASALMRIREHCIKFLASFKVPESIYQVALLPRAAINKVNKAELQRIVLPGVDLQMAERRWAQIAKSVE